MKFTKTVARLALISLLPLAASAETLPGKHPGYLHSLSDLRAARWFLYRQPGDPAVSSDEDMAIIQIDRAIAEIKRASIDDGKDLNDHPNVDVREHGSRLLKSIEALKKARADIEGEEDNPEVGELRRAAIAHVDKAVRAAENAHNAWLKSKH